MPPDPPRREIRLCPPVVFGGEEAYLLDALRSGWLMSGPYVERFEDAVRRVTGSRYAVGCVNGTAGLHLALRLAGVRPDEAVIVPTVTFIATANAVRHQGAEPVLMDCDDRLCMDAMKLAAYFDDECDEASEGVLVERSSGRRVSAVVPVHVFGVPCDPDVFAVAASHGVPVIEDAAEALGSSWTGGALAGRGTGTVGLLGTLSFNANKIVTAGGGGMILTGVEDLAARARHLVAQAKSDEVWWVHDDAGYNYRLPNLQAAVGLAQIERLDEVLARRRTVREVYREELADVPGVSLMDDPGGTAPNLWFLAALLDADLGRVMGRLREAGVETRPLWRPVHLQQAYRGCRAYRVERAEGYARRVLSLPCGFGLTDDDVRHVAGRLREAVT